MDKRYSLPSVTLLFGLAIGFVLGIGTFYWKVVMNSTSDGLIHPSSLQEIDVPSLDTLTQVEAGTFKYMVDGTFLLDVPLHGNSNTPSYWVARVTMPTAFASQFMPWVFEDDEGVYRNASNCYVMGYSYLGRMVNSEDVRLFGRALSLTCEAGYLSKTVRGWFIDERGEIGISPVAKSGDPVRLLVVTHALEFTDFMQELKVEADALADQKAEQQQKLNELKLKQKQYWQEILKLFRRRYGDVFIDA